MPVCVAFVVVEPEVLLYEALVDLAGVEVELDFRSEPRVERCIVLLFDVEYVGLNDLEGLYTLL